MLEGDELWDAVEQGMKNMRGACCDQEGRELLSWITGESFAGVLDEWLRDAVTE